MVAYLNKIAAGFLTIKCPTLSPAGPIGPTTPGCPLAPLAPCSPFKIKACMI